MTLIPDTFSYRTVQFYLYKPNTTGLITVGGFHGYSASQYAQ